MLEILAGLPGDPNLIPGQEDFFPPKFLLKRKCDKWKRTTTTTTATTTTATTTRVISWSLADGRTMKMAEIEADFLGSNVHSYPATPY